MVLKKQDLLIIKIMNELTIPNKSKTSPYYFYQILHECLRNQQHSQSGTFDTGGLHELVPVIVNDLLLLCQGTIFSNVVHQTLLAAYYIQSESRSVPF